MDNHKRGKSVRLLFVSASKANTTQTLNNGKRNTLMYPKCRKNAKESQPTHKGKLGAYSKWKLCLQAGVLQYPENVDQNKQRGNSEANVPKIKQMLVSVWEVHNTYGCEMQHRITMC
jgi:hypothetical protein